jgi:hypothetical protein
MQFANYCSGDDYTAVEEKFGSDKVAKQWYEDVQGTERAS